jgi:hypothetical protein
MGRPPPIRLDAPIDRDAVLSASRAVTESPRDVEALDRLRELLAFGQGLSAWVSQFDVSGPATLLASAAIGHRGIDAVLLYIEDTLARLAPHKDHGTGTVGTATLAHPEPPGASSEIATAPGGVSANAWQQAQKQLCKTINTFRFVREHVGGNLRSEPDIAYPNEPFPDDVPWRDAWEPADEETAVVALTRFARIKRHRLRDRDAATAQRVHDRIATVARDFVRAFVLKMQAENSGGGLPRIQKLVDQLRPGSRKANAKMALRKLSLLMPAILQLVPTETPGEPTPFGKPFQEFFAAELVERFIEAGREYAQTCLPLLESRKGSLQAARKKLLRQFAVVAQYAYVASGNGWYGRFAELLAAVDVFADALQKDTEALLDAPSVNQQAEADSIQTIVRVLNVRIVEPRVADLWRATLGNRAGFCGKLIELVVNSEGGQAKPWSRGDVVPTLSRAGLITAKGKNGRGKAGSVTDACMLMQQVGLAVQVPLDYLLSESGSLPKRKKKDDALFSPDGLPWLVNPLGAVLAEEAMNKEAGQPRKDRKSRVKQRDAVIPMPQRAGKKSAKKACKKASKKAARKDRLPVTKAAKKWPRA